jgi:hypothetical protein
LRGSPFVILVVAVGGSVLFAAVLPGGRATESFYTTSAAIAASLLVALTVAAGTIVTDRPERSRAGAIVWIGVILVSFLANAGAAAGSLAALNHCQATRNGTLCGDGLDTRLVAAAFGFGVVVLLAQILVGKAHTPSKL